MGMVELIKEYDGLYSQVHDEGTASNAWPRIREIEREMIGIVSRSGMKCVPTVVSHGSTTLVIEPNKSRVDFALGRSALFIDSMLDPYGKIDRNAPTTELADLADVSF